MIVKEEAAQPLRTSKKRRRDGKKKDVEVMQVIEHILRIVSFSATDGEGIEMPHDDTLVVKEIIHNLRVQKNLVDIGKKVNLLPYHVFQAMKILEENLVRDQTPIKGIGVVLMQVEGKVKLLLTLETPPPPLQLREHNTPNS